MNAEQKFYEYIQKWASGKRCTFVEQGCDGRESDHLIDGMSADDVWGWLLPEGVTDVSDEYFGCIVWREENGRLVLEWETRVE